MGSLFVFGIGKASAATYYADKADGTVCYDKNGWPSDHAGTRACSYNINSIAAKADCTTLIIAAGTYANTELGASNYLTSARSNQVIRGALSTDGGSDKSGRVILSGSGTTYGSVVIAHSGVTLSYLSITSTMAGTAGYALKISGDAFVINDVEVYGTTTCNGIVIYAGYGGTFNHLKIHDIAFARYVFDWSGSNVTVNYGMFYNNAPGNFRHNGSSGSILTLNNMLYYGNTGSIIAASSNTGQNIIVNNSIIFNNASASSTQKVVENTVNASITINNSMIQYNSRGNVDGAYQNTTLNNCIDNKSPKFVHAKYPSVVSFIIDDAPNAPEFASLAAKVESYGWRAGFALNAGYTGIDWELLGGLAKIGHEIIPHTLTHANLPAITEAEARAEIVGSKTMVEASISGSTAYGGGTYTARSFACPFNATNAAVQGYILDAGFLGSRGYDGDNSPTYLSSANIYNLRSWSAFIRYAGSSQATTYDNIKRNVIADMESLKEVGGVHIIYSHDFATQFTSTQWDAILAAVYDSGVPVMTLGDAVAYIRANGTDSGDHMTFTRTLTDQSDYHLQSTSPAIDAGTNVSLTSDYEGNPIYGTPDIGGYEYQPTHDMAAATPDQPQIGEAIRVYGNGKFRNTIDDSEDNDTDAAKLSIVPQGSLTTKWLDLNISAWNTSGDYHKTWTENSDTLGSDNTLHTIGDLAPDQAYSVKIDDVLASANITGTDCATGSCTADENGEIIFTYTGGYGEHTFDIEDETAPVIAITSPETGDTVSGDDTITFTDTEATDPECSIDNTNWISCTTTVTSFNDLTGWDDIEESDTFTLYMRDTDGAGNTGTANVANLIKADTQAPIRSDGSPSGELASNTTQTTLSLTTSESATCKYSTSSGTAYGSMTDVFANVGGTAHTATVSGLSNGASYSYYVRCQDESENSNDTDYLISFSVASTPNTDENTDTEKDPNLHNLTSSSTQDSITLTWKTDHNTKSSIRYGTDRNLKEKKKDSQKEKKHKVILKDLLPNTKYYFRIKATDSDDNEDSSSIHSIMTKPAPVSNANSNATSSSNENTNQTPAPTENTATPSYSGNSSPNVCSYTVESGDTLWSIAKKIYGDATAYPLIIEKNKEKYPDIESKLSIGQELTFCDNGRSSQTTGNSSNTDKSSQSSQAQIQTEPQTSTFHWWNPLSWF